MLASQVISGCQMVKNHKYYHNMRYRTYPTSLSRINWLRLHFGKSSKNDNSGIWVPQGGIECLKFRFKHFFCKLDDSEWFWAEEMSFWAKIKNFEKSSKKWLSLEATVKEKKSKISKTIYFHELHHSEWFGAKNFFRILDHSKMSKTEPHGENWIFRTGFFWT